jgi:lipoate-protein ligase A
VAVTTAAPGTEARPGPTAPDSDRACFADTAPGEVLASGRKLIGSAQWRHDGVLLQHGSLLLHDDQLLAGQTGVAESGPASGAIGLADLLPEVPDEETLIAALEAGFEEEFGVAVERGTQTAEERRAARLLEQKHHSKEWIWRR